MYLVDSNVLISAKNSYYGMDFAPGFWSWIRHAHDDGLVGSVDKVREELVEAGDNLSEWVQGCPAGFFSKPDDGSTEHLKAVAAWASTADFHQAAVNDFLTKADYFLLAQARQGNDIVVTNEVHDPNARKIIKIPTAGFALGVECIKPWEMFRREGVQFTT